MSRLVKFLRPTIYKSLTSSRLSNCNVRTKVTVWSSQTPSWRNLGSSNMFTPEVCCNRKRDCLVFYSVATKKLWWLNVKFSRVNWKRIYGQQWGELICWLLDVRKVVTESVIVCFFLRSGRLPGNILQVFQQQNATSSNIYLYCKRQVHFHVDQR
jgi:hypothetical protein